MSGVIVLRLEGLSPEATQVWQQRLNRYYLECGCSAGAVVLLAAMLVYGLYLLVPFTPSIGGWFAKMATGCGLAVLAAGVGKALGLLRARHRLRQAIRELLTAVG
jgi:hypothetical protein